MNKFLILGSIYALFVASTLSFPAVDTDTDSDVVDQDNKALIAMRDDGTPEYVVVGQGLGRAGLNTIRNIFNFTGYLGTPPNTTAITFVPLITILSSLTPQQG